MVGDCSTICLNGAIIDCDDILEDIEKHEVLVILRNGENQGPNEFEDPGNLIRDNMIKINDFVFCIFILKQIIDLNLANFSVCARAQQIVCSDLHAQYNLLSWEYVLSIC